MRNNIPVLLLHITGAISMVTLGYSSWSVGAECQPAQQLRLSKVQFNAASVMPVVMMKKSSDEVSTLYALLSREARGKDKDTYDDWGGSRDKGEGHPVVTAAREFSEEAITERTLGMNCGAIRKYIDLDTGNTLFVVVQEGIGRRRVGGSGSTMVTYITKFSPEQINNFVAKFYPARQECKNQGKWKYTEKNRLALVRWSDLARTIREATSAKEVQLDAQLIDKDPCKEKQESITLRPALVAKLRSLFKRISPHMRGKNKKILFFEPYQHRPAKEPAPAE